MTAAVTRLSLMTAAPNASCYDQLLRYSKYALALIMVTYALLSSPFELLLHVITHNRCMLYSIYTYLSLCTAAMPSKLCCSMNDMIGALTAPIAPFTAAALTS
jgi:hypothetical protein